MASFNSKAEFMANGLTHLTAEDAHSFDADCTVCYLPFSFDTTPAEESATDPVRITSCGHVFCNSCLSEWCETSEGCPMCRRTLFTPRPRRAGPDPQTIESPGPWMLLLDNQPEPLVHHEYQRALQLRRTGTNPRVLSPRSAFPALSAWAIPRASRSGSAAEEPGWDSRVVPRIFQSLGFVNGEDGWVDGP